MNEEKETINVDTSDVVDQPSIKIKIRAHARRHRMAILLSQCSFFISLILFITLSLTVKGPFGPYNLNGWAFWWMMFLIVPILTQTYEAIVFKKWHLIPIDWLAIISYLLVGLLTGLWHPYWALLFIGPAFHLIIAPILRHLR